MGHELTREARAGMPRGWSMGQRAVVLILADICNDRTRRQPPHMDASERLCEELDITPGTLRNILTRLAAAGFEFRSAVGKDKHGTPMFAHRGHAVDYQFPAIPPRTPKGPLNDGPKAFEGASIDAPLTPEPDVEGASVSAPSTPKVHPSMRKGASVSAPQTTVTPKSKEDTRSLSPVAAPATDRAHEAPDDERENDAGEDEEEDEEEPDPDVVLLAGAVPGADPRDVEWAVEELGIRKAQGGLHSTVRAYLRKVIKEGDARSFVDDAAADRRRAEADDARWEAAHGDMFDPFGSPASTSGRQADPWAPAAPFAGPVVAGEVIQPDAQRPSVPRIADPEAHAARLAALKADLAAKRQTTGSRPEWCGQCNERTRQVDLDDGRVARCTSCHPAAVVPATSATPR